VNRPQIGIIIPSFNDKPFLEDLLESMYTVEAGATFFPVVVNDHSTDGTAEWLMSVIPGYGAVVTPDQKCYFTRSVNVGLSWARQNLKPEYYFLLNSDTVVTDGWGLALITTSFSLRAGIVGATLLYPDGRIQHAGAYGAGYHYGINKPFVNYRQDRLVPWVTGAAMAIKSDVIEGAGYLPTADDTKQYDASDRRYCVDARMRGVEVAVSADCVIIHRTLQAESVRRARGDY
jgi:GT2 family glycosyltransferase